MDVNILDTINTRELGKRLQEARQKRGLTQEDAAKILDVARTTITAIEKGERRLKASELIRLARAYGRQVSDFVRQRPAIESLQVQFRGPASLSQEDREAIAPQIGVFEEYCRDYLELENIAGSQQLRKYPAEYSIEGLSVEQAAEAIALEERNRLALGDGPIPILRDILEQDVGVRIFYLSLPSQFSAMYFYSDQLGGCIAINRNHPEGRRRWSLAHDYLHFLAHRDTSSVFVEGEYQRVPESERIADAFARYFLMPTSGLTRRFNDLRRTKPTVTFADLCTLAYYYGVSVAALTLRLEEMRLLPLGLWGKLRESGLKVRDAQNELGLEAIPAQAEPLPVRYQYLALDAFDQELITEAQFAHFLHVDRLKARRIAEILRQHASDVTDTTNIELSTAQLLNS